MVQGIEHQVKGNSIVPVGGKLPYYLELQTSKLLDLLVVISIKNDNDKNLRTKINRYLYSKTAPEYYVEINEHLHLAYADQRDGHGTKHWWRLFFDNSYKEQVEQFTRKSALTVPGKDTPHNDTGSGREVKTDVNPLYEWGGMYFRSKAEIKIAEELDHKKVLFFANSRGRIGRQGSPSQLTSIPGWLLFLAAAGAIAAQAWHQITTYPQRKREHDDEVAGYPRKLKGYEQKKREHEEEVKVSQSREGVSEFRYKLLLEILRQTVPHDGNGSAATTNPEEAKFGNYLNRY